LNTYLAKGKTFYDFISSVGIFLVAFYKVYFILDYMGSTKGFYGKVVTMKYYGLAETPIIPKEVQSFYFPLSLSCVTCLKASLMSNNLDLHYISIDASHS
jgi:hypothetical protein